MKKILIGMAGFLLLMGGLAVGDGTAQTTYTISGSVIRTFDNAPVSGVTMTGLPGNPTTDSNGNYSGTVPTNWSGIVKPQKIGYAIFPFSTEYTNVATNQTQNYSAVLLPKVALSMPPTTYNLGDPINITMTLENQGSDLFTSQGFMATNFALFLQFYDPDNNLITSNYGVGRTPLSQPILAVTTPEGKVELLQVEYVERVPAGWVLSMPFNALNYYTLSNGGNYSVKAKISMRAYLSESVSETQTNPPSGIFFAPHDSGSSGDAESNIVSFTLSVAQAVLHHITISPASATIVAGGSQSYTAEGFDTNNTSMGDMTGATTFLISPNGNCTGNTCRATVGGAHTVTASNSGKTATATLQVNPGTLNSITISPASATITAGGNQVYTATGYDQYNNRFDVTGATTFSITPDGSCTGAICTATIPGLHTVTGNDGGKTATASLSVVAYTFIGFFSPVNNLPVLNSVKAGQAIPVKFSLNGNQGLSIFATGYPTSATIVCSSVAPVDTVEQTVTAGGSSLSYDPASDQYTYVWKTDKAWSNTCRQLVVKFKDGTYQRANFQFKK
jgi:hypothetical protein